ncbi:MAG: hypothetical protein ACRD0P_23225 [Stackebrandtia sp.]
MNLIAAMEHANTSLETELDAAGDRIRQLEAVLETEDANRYIAITSTRIAALRTEIGRADLKAQIFLALAAPAVTAIVVTDTLAGLRIPAAITAWSAVGLAVAAIAVFATGLWPRLSKHGGLGALSINPACTTLTAHVRTLRTEQADATSLAVSKYRRIRYGMGLSAAAGLLGVTSAVLTHLS